MGVFYVDCSVQRVTGSGNAITVSNLSIDTGSEYTWIAEQDPKNAAITVRKNDVPFVMANDQLIARHIEYDILRCQDFETVDKAVFSREGGVRLLGSRTLEGFGAVLDAREAKLMAAGPYPVARGTRRVHP